MPVASLAEGIYEFKVLRHVLGVANIIPDALSRLASPELKSLSVLLQSASVLKGTSFE